MSTTKFSYVPRQKRNTSENKASVYTTDLVKSDFDKFGNSSLTVDHNQILNTGCTYIPNFFLRNR